MIEYMLIAGVGGFFGTCGRYLTGVAAKKDFWIRISVRHIHRQCSRLFYNWFAFRHLGQP